MAELSCVGEDGCEPGEPCPCHPSQSNTEGWARGWDTGCPEHHSKACFLCNESLGM